MPNPLTVNDDNGDFLNFILSEHALKVNMNRKSNADNYAGQFTLYHNGILLCWPFGHREEINSLR